MTPDPPGGGGDWWHINSLRDLIQLAAIPFAAIGGGAGIKVFMDGWAQRGQRKDSRHDKDVAEREAVRASFDAKQSAYINRVEKAEADLRVEIDRITANFRREEARLHGVIAAEREDRDRKVEELEAERDLVWAVGLDQEEERHRDRHLLMAVGQRLNAVLAQFRRKIEGALSPEAEREILAMEPERDPPRVPDIRSKVRVKSARPGSGGAP